MALLRYKLHRVIGPVSKGAMQSQIVAVLGIAKCANAAHPYAVSNEVLCGHLGRALGLPIPPGIIMPMGGVDYYLSLDANLSGQILPPIIPSQAVPRYPELAAGTMLFDAWVVNPDRHSDNLAIEPTTAHLFIFDHSHAFMNGTSGVAAFQAQANSLGTGGHCLAPYITTVAHFPMWLSRLTEIPSYLVRHAVEEASNVGLLPSDTQLCIGFLDDRRKRMRELLKQHGPSACTAVPAAEWLQL
jgi:hypothetical protein